LNTPGAPATQVTEHFHSIKHTLLADALAFTVTASHAEDARPFTLRPLPTPGPFPARRGETDFIPDEWQCGRGDAQKKWLIFRAFYDTSTLYASP